MASVLGCRLEQELVAAGCPASIATSVAIYTVARVCQTIRRDNCALLTRRRCRYAARAKCSADGNIAGDLVINRWAQRDAVIANNTGMGPHAPPLNVRFLIGDQ